MRLSHAACETERNSCGIIAGIAPPTVLGDGVPFVRPGHSESPPAGHRPRRAATSAIGHRTRGTADVSRIVGAVSRELLAVETDNSLTIYTDQRRGRFKIIIVRYIRIDSSRINRTTTLSLKSDTISLGLEFCETVAQSFKSVIRIENSDLGGSPREKFTACDGERRVSCHATSLCE